MASKQERARNLHAQADRILRQVSEEIVDAGPCYAYLAGLSELEELYENLTYAHEPEVIEDYHRDIRDTILRIESKHPLCSRRVEKVGRKIISDANRLPGVPSSLKPVGSRQGT
jgi:hypothetical protein